MNEEEKQSIEILSSFEPIDLIDGVIYIQAVEKLKNSIDKLKKENEKLKNQEAITKIKNELLVQRYSNYIPVQTVKDKIEELKQEKKKYGNCLIEMYEDELVNRDIKILQELLESEEK